ncbi:hypothetical protein N0V90_010474 [Kalmusia sp. IMI 367209]|nr:hypothetical protein N0V90_010474 [Kalmusia sp. IMI 367209]
MNAADQSNPVAEGNSFELHSRVQAIDLEKQEATNVEETPSSKTMYEIQRFPSAKGPNIQLTALAIYGMP